MEQRYSFGYWIRRRRKALDLTQRDLANQAGCALGTLKKIESDERRPSKQLAERLATCLAIPDGERLAFLRAARAELAVDRLSDTMHEQTVSLFPAHAHHNVPMQLTTLIGRDQDVAVVCELLRNPDTRLVTLTGTGGVGKTRLAIQAATELRDSFPDGVVFIELAPISDPGLVAAQIAHALDVQEHASRPLAETLQDALRERCTLLLLDNFEHVLDAAPLITTLLATAPGLKVLVTSREVLRLRSEKELPVPPLELPATQHDMQVAELMQSSAAQLFVARARDVQPGFAVTDVNAPIVAAICMHLDGLPLAIELAATRVKLFPLESLLARLSGRLAVLTGGPRDLPARQQSLRNTIDWSYSLLNPDEQQLFRRLGVFAGSWTLEAAESLYVEGTRYSEDTANTVTEALLPLMSSLLDKSLLRRLDQPDDEPRFAMLETVREYALERLAEFGELADIRRRHATFFLQLAEAAEPELWGPEQVEWLRRLQAEHDNLRAVLAWSQGDGEIHEIGARIAIALAWFWLWRGYRHEGAAYVREALVEETKPTLLRAKLLHALGMFAMESDVKPARELFEESLVLFRAHGDLRGQADTLYDLGWLPTMQGIDDPAAAGRFAESLSLYRQIGHTLGIARILGVVTDGGADNQERCRESLALYHSVGHLRGQADALRDLARMAHGAGDLTRSLVLLEESLSLFRQLQDEGGALWALLILGEVYFDREEVANAATYVQESVDLARRLNDRMALGFALQSLGKAELLHNQLPDLARQHFAESITIFEELNIDYGVWQGIIGHARVAATVGAADWAVRWCASVEALSTARDWSPSTWTPEQYHCYERALAAARPALDHAAFDAAWETGRALTLDQVIAETLTVQLHIADG